MPVEMRSGSGTGDDIPPEEDRVMGIPNALGDAIVAPPSVNTR
jgi:hypothetical protein